MIDGQQMGCNDTGKSEHYSDWQLSRAADLLDAAKRLKGDGIPETLREDFYKLLPWQLKFDLTWCSWKYEAITRKTEIRNPTL